MERCRTVLSCGAVFLFSFTQFVISENLSILDLELSGGERVEQAAYEVEKALGNAYILL